MRVYIKKEENVTNDNVDISVTINELDNVIQSSATELICEDILDFNEDRQAVLQKLVSKLRYTGRIVLTGIDVDELSRELLNRNISPREAVSYLYSGRRSGSTINIMIEDLQNFGLRVINTRLHGTFYYIVAQRDARN